MIGLTSSPGALLCIDDTASFTDDSNLLVAHSVVPSNGQTFVEVVNVTNQPISVRNGTMIGKLVECELVPYSINKLRTNAISASNSEFVTYRLEDVGVDTSDLTESQNQI